MESEKDEDNFEKSEIELRDFSNDSRDIHQSIKMVKNGDYGSSDSLDTTMRRRKSFSTYLTRDIATMTKESSMLDEAKYGSKSKKLNIFTRIKIVISFYVSGSWKLFLIVSFIFIVTGILLLLLLQNDSISKMGTYPPNKYDHPLTQSFHVFFAKFIFCLFPSYIVSGIDKYFLCDRIYGKKRVKKPVNVFIFLVPALFNTLGMLRSIIVLFTFVLSIVLLKRKFYRFPHKWVGVFVVLLGSGVLFISLSLRPQTLENTEQHSAPFLGAIVTLISVMMSTMWIISEEWLLSSYDTGPFQVPGFEGMFGVLFLTPLLLICYLIPGDDHGSLENPFAAFEEMLYNPLLLLFVFLIYPVNAAGNIVGNLITKFLSASTRSIVTQVVPAVIWVIQIARGAEEFDWGQLGGYIVIVFGVMVFNEIGFSTFCPFYSNWCEKIRKKDEIKKQKKIIGDD